MEAVELAVSASELELLVLALGELEAERGLREEGEALLERLRELRERCRSSEF